MSNLLSASQAVALLERLRDTVRDFVDREESLGADLAASREEAKTKLQTSVKKLEAALERDVDEARSRCDSAKQRADARFDRWQARIEQAYNNAKARKLQEIEAREDQKKCETQAKLLQANRERDKGTKEAEYRFNEFRTQLATEYESIENLYAIAHKSFRGYRSFLKRLTSSPDAREPDPDRSEDELIQELKGLLDQATIDIRRFRRRLLPMIFRNLPLVLLIPFIIVIHLAAVVLLPSLDIASLSSVRVAGSGVGVVIGVLLAHYLGGRGARSLAHQIADALVSAFRLYDVCHEKSENTRSQTIQQLEARHEQTVSALNSSWSSEVEGGATGREETHVKLEAQRNRLLEKNERRRRRLVEYEESQLQSTLERLRTAAESKAAEFEAGSDQEGTRREDEAQASWDTLESEWSSRLPPLFETIKCANKEAEGLFPEWMPDLWNNWSLPAEFAHAAKLGRLEVNLKALCQKLPQDGRLALPEPNDFAVPISLSFPKEGSLLLETKASGHSSVVDTINNAMLRILTTAPAGKVSFVIVDPVGLGQNFAGIMHLADYEENLINSRIWTQTNQIEEKLAELTEHMEKVTQMYLRNEFETIAEYNEEAGNIAEKYHFLVVADFPSGFSETAAKRLQSIAASGGRCGVYTLIHWNHQHPLPADFIGEDLRSNSVCIECTGEGARLRGQPKQGAKLILDPAPDPDFAIDLVHKVGQSSVDSNRVEVPFAHIAPDPTKLWSSETTDELRVPIGRTGATKLQHLAIGKGTRQHVLIAGKTGSGKSTLLHVMVTNLALWCSPNQVEFYLVDFKKGVEFKCYATRGLPHARVVAIESDREFGLSVLQRVDDELKRRGDLFRKLGVQDIGGYKKAAGDNPMPRTLLIIDEFQEFFVEDDRISQNASVLLDRIVRQGRAFGIHVILGSQTLGGAYTLARTTLGQMVIRIALQCNEADAYLIMEDNNPAPRLLTRPGEAIYNDSAGALEGNSPFQIVWLPDDEREARLQTVFELAGREASVAMRPIVFEGNAPADITENGPLQELLQASTVAAFATYRFWLGAPNSIKGPTEAIFGKQSGSNLLIVGQREEAALAMLSLAVITLSAQFPAAAVRFIVVDASLPDSSQRLILDRTKAAVPHEVVLAKNSDLPEILNELSSDLKRRGEEDQTQNAPATFFLVNGLQKFKKLRQEDEFSISLESAEGEGNTGPQFNDLICGGPSVGIHVIASCDTYNNVQRFLSRKAVSEFEMRVLFQMSANDSASLIDSTKASQLGLHRALYYNEQAGYLETFRPYAMPEADWIAKAGEDLAKRM